jgi:hypothetical protein
MQCWQRLQQYLRPCSAVVVSGLGLQFQAWESGVTCLGPGYGVTLCDPNHITGFRYSLLTGKLLNDKRIKENHFFFKKKLGNAVSLEERG